MNGNKMELIDGATFEKLAQMVEEGDMFKAYKSAIEDGNKATDLLLGVDVLLRTVIDEDFFIIFQKVATDTLCERLDGHFRRKILGNDTGASEALDFAENLLKKGKGENANS